MADKRVGVPEKITGAIVKMGIRERLIIGQLLPQKGNMLEQRLIKDILSKSEITQEEMTRIQIASNPGGGVTWSAEAERKMGNHSVHFSEAEIGFLKDQIKKLDEKGDITRDIYEFCEKVINLAKGEK